MALVHHLPVEAKLVQSYQKIIVMRHGDRIDFLEPQWLSGATRKWDPPLHEEGIARALNSAHKLHVSTLGYPIHRIFVSPFLRCLQTASQVALTLPNIKISVQYGLFETFNDHAIRDPPKEGEDWGFGDLTELENKLPTGTVDPMCEQVYPGLPKWGETREDASGRVVRVIRTLADKYPFENLLLITHARGVKASVATFMRDVKASKVQYCGYLQLRREIGGGGGTGKEPFEGDEFELLADQSVGMITFTSLTNHAIIVNDIDSKVDKI